MFESSDLKIKVEPRGQWRPLFLPGKLCLYVNDHTIFRDGEGRWRVLGTCGSGPYNPLREYYFVECSSDDLHQPMREERRIFHRHLQKPIKISPFVFYDQSEGLYHLHFGHCQICHYVSKDGRD